MNNLTSPLAVSLSGLPSSIQATPSAFTLNPGGSQKVTLTASASAVLGNTTVTVIGSVGSLSHSAACQLQVVAGTAQFRMRYFDTAEDLPADLNFNIQPHALYNPAIKRFFFADAGQNRILVYDAATELQIADIIVPGAWALDQSPDQGTLYVGTQVGTIYLIDPVGMAVKQSIPANRIGPNGYAAYGVHPLADGRLALLGDQGGIPAVDGYGSFAIWNPADNSFAQYTTQYKAVIPTPGQVVCGSLESIAYLAVTPDRTKLMLGSADSDATVCQFDPSTGNYATVTAPGELYVGTTTVFQPPDGKEFLTSAQGSVYVFNSSTMQLQDQFSVAEGLRCILSLDGNTLYALGLDVTAYNWRTHAMAGWASSPTVSGYHTDLEPLAVDETGLIAGVLGHGVGFADAGTLSSGATDVGVVGANVLPSLGPTAGGTTVQFYGAPIDPTALNIFFGTEAGSDLSFSSSTPAATSPPHAAGVVDVTLQATSGGLVSAFSWFSYGPSITKILTPTSSAEGGATETIFGYGFAPGSSTTAPSDLKVSIGNQQVQIAAYKSLFNYADGGTPTSLQVLQFTLPSGSAGSSVDLTISNSSGTTTLPGAISYISPVQQFYLPRAQLFQGVYDSRRDVYYFTDQAQIRVFSRSSGWLAAIAIPAPAGASSQRLVGVSISPDGTKLAVSDAAADVIYVLNPDVPTSIQTFTLPNTVLDAGTEPCGLAISDQGMVYYASFDTIGYGLPSFHKLDVSTGTVTAYAGFGSNGPADFYTRVLLTPDNQRVFYLQQGDAVYVIETASDTVERTTAANTADYELALSANGASLAAGESLFDVDLNLNASLADNELQAYDESGVYGEKLSPDGNFLLTPLANSIEIFDGKTGVLLTRIGLPLSLSPNYDALVSDGRDNVITYINGNGNGVAVVDLSFVQGLSRQSSITAQDQGRAPVSMLLSGVKPTANREPVTGNTNFQATTQRYWKHLLFSSSRREPAQPAAEDNQTGNRQFESATTQTEAGPATSPMAFVNIGQKGTQSITFDPIPSGQLGDSVALNVSATSGLPVSLVSKAPSVCIVAGDIASLVGIGICTVQAVQDGNDDYTAARSMMQKFVVTRKSQTISFSGLPGAATFGVAGPYTLLATSSAGLPVSLSVTGPAIVSGSRLIVTGAGTIVVTASQPGNAYYGQADAVSQTIVISPAENINAGEGSSK